jgi:DNA polymerase I-like protein with 3'-5' exonuclease and polymerase domains
MFTPDSEWTAPNLSDLPKWEGVPRIGLDTEGCDPQLTKLGPGVRRDGYTCGISFALEDGPAHYLPMRHLGGGNLDPDKVEAYMKDQAKTYTGTICGANLQYDLDYLAERGIIFRSAKFKDIQVAEPLIDENQLSYSLETLAQKYGFMGKDETLLTEAAKAYGWIKPKDVKSNMWQLPAKYVGPYATEDAVLPLLILRKQERIIEDQELEQIYALECKVLPVLVKMRRRGIRIDFDQLARVEALTIKKEQEFLNIIYAETGVRIQVDEINKTKLVVRALDVAQIPYGQTEPSSKFPEGQPSVKKEYLEPNKDLPLVNAILEARSYNKVRNTFVASIRNHATNGRIHCTFNQLRRQDDNSDDVKGAGPGRLSSCSPNLQQQPSRHPVLGKMWRSIYLPDEGGRWAALDYSQQEPRLFIHYAHIAGCAGTQEAVEGFHKGLDWHDMTTEMAFGMCKWDHCKIVDGEEVWVHDKDKKKWKQLRGRAKAVFLGLTYGMGQAKMCKSCGFETEIVNIRGAEREVAGPEGRAFLTSFNQKVPFLSEIKDMVERVAWNRKYIRTILGRHIHYPPGAGMERKALNNLIQGSAADQTKLAMVLMDENNFRIQLQIHDEIDTTVYSENTAKEMAEIMTNCVSLVVPAKVDIEIGDNWGDSME